ncbi:hypothetical protein, partial [Pseudomonas aeruginosa]|uniref:hypothetical protein n=1 Tax=Pseudomonas aeruginosa TaxID=287 RepID=UPI001CA5A916
EGVGATAAALVDLSTVAGNKISNPPWVKFQSAGWVNFPSAPTSVVKIVTDASYMCKERLRRALIVSNFSPLGHTINPYLSLRWVLKQIFNRTSYIRVLFSK